MNKKAEPVRSFKGGCLKKTAAQKRSVNIFDEAAWEVFVIKKDQATGKLIGVTACCALARV